MRDIRGRRRSVTDPDGNTTTYSYDGLDHLIRITRPEITKYAMPAGSVNHETFLYDPEGLLTEETDRLGLTRTYTHTSRHQTESVTRNIGGTKKFGHDGNGNLTSESDWKGNATTHSYDALNRRISTTNRLGHIMSMGYDANDNLTSVTDYEENRTTHTYDALNRRTETVHPEPDGGTLTYTYYNESDPATNLHTDTDPEGNTTAYEYNGRHLRTKRTDALDGEHLWKYDDAGNLSSETDEEGHVTLLEHDGQNWRIRATRKMTHWTEEWQIGHPVTEYGHDANGNVVSVTDPLGHVTRTEYDEWNRAWRVTDPEGYVTKTEYDGRNNAVRTTDSNGHVRTRDRDRRGLVLKETDAEGAETSLTYDLNGNTGTVTNAEGRVTRHTHDAEDRLMTTTEGENLGEPHHPRTRAVISRDRMGNPTSESDFNGNVTKTSYNALNLPAEVTDPAGKTTRTAYWKTGKVRSVTNRRDHATSYEHDALNRLIRVTDPLNQVVVTGYDKVGNVTSVTDRRGILTENVYDDLYRPEIVRRAGQRLETKLHDKAGNVRFMTDANGNRTEHVYDGRRFLTETSHPDGTSVKRTYDGVGSLLTLTDEEGKITTYAYDRENREISAKFAGEVTRKTYNAVGNLTSVIRSEGNVRRNAYDPFGRLSSVTDDPGGLNLVTRYEYDDNDNLRHQHGPSGSHTEYTYNELNRKRSHVQHSASGNSVTGFNEYDGEGNLLKMTDANGKVFRYKYDALGRRTDAYRPDADLPYLSVTHITTAYDPNDNVVSVTENKSGTDGPVTDTTVSMWDNLDRLESRTQRGVSTDYDYDANGNRTLVATPSGETTYSYDSRNRLKTAVADGETTTCTYTPDGKKGTVSYPNGTESVYAYHPDNRVRSITNRVTDDESVISSFEYEYTPNGNRERQVAVQNGAAETTDYTYDRADRLTAFTVTDGADTTLTEYTFDGHNRKTETVTKNDTVVRSRTYHHDDTDRITDIEDDTDPENPRTITYGYDRNGNMVSKSDSSMPAGDMSFVYNSADQMVQAIRGPPESGTVLGLYDYNHAGLRVRHRLSERGDVDYYYDENAVIEERNADDDSLLAFYRYADRLISLDTGAEKQYYHHDALGSTVNLTDESGGVRVSYRLDPWGHVKEQIGESVNRQIFTGHEHDGNTGLIYCKGRYYDPDIARFITQDAYLGELSVPPSLHRYLYAYSNPLVYIDLYGYDVSDIWPGVRKAVSGGIRGMQISLREMHGLPEAVNRNVAPESWHGQAVATGVKTAGEVVLGVVLSPLDLADQGVEYYRDPLNPNKIPIFGPQGRALGESWAHATYFDSSFESYSVAVGQVLFALDTALAGAAIYRGLSTDTEAVISAGSGAVRFPVLRNITSEGQADAFQYAKLKEHYKLLERAYLNEKFRNKADINLDEAISWGTGYYRGLKAPEGGEKLVTIKRFATRNDPETLMPNISYWDRFTQAKVSLLMRFGTYRAWHAHRHMRGYTKDSPFVSAVRDAKALSETLDDWASTITTGWPVVGGVRRAPDIGTFKVPESRLISPRQDNVMSIDETEVVFRGDDLKDFLIRWETNPFK